MLAGTAAVASNDGEVITKLLIANSKIVLNRGAADIGPSHANIHGAKVATARRSENFPVAGSKLSHAGRGEPSASVAISVSVRRQDQHLQTYLRVPQN